MKKERKELYIEDLKVTVAPSHASAVRKGGGEALIGVVRAGLLSREIAI
jgi:hypothetical protein